MMAAGSSRSPVPRPTKAPSVSAAVAAATENADSMSSYKRKLFFRRLKVVLMALIALTLLLLGCLLGFVIPASLEVKGQERSNVTTQDRRNLSTINVTESSPKENNTRHVFTTPSLSTVLNLTDVSTIPSVTETTSTTNIYPTKEKSNKWWLLTIQDSISAAKKNLLRTSLTTSKPAESPLPSRNFHNIMSDSKWKFVQNEQVAEQTSTGSPAKLTETVTNIEGTTLPSFTISNSATKWWQQMIWRENLHNQLQKKERNNTTRAPIATASLVRANYGNWRVQQRFDRRTTISIWEDSKNQFLRNNANQTNRPNVRRVTSYPRQNSTTTTTPSVVTRLM